MSTEHDRNIENRSKIFNKVIIIFKQMGISACLFFGSCSFGSTEKLNLSIHLINVPETKVKIMDQSILFLEYRETRHIPLITYERYYSGHSGGLGGTALPREKSFYGKAARVINNAVDSNFLFESNEIEKRLFSLGGYTLFRISIYYSVESFGKLQPDEVLNVDDLQFKVQDPKFNVFEKSSKENVECFIQRNIEGEYSTITAPLSVSSICLNIDFRNGI